MRRDSEITWSMCQLQRREQFVQPAEDESGVEERQFQRLQRLASTPSHSCCHRSGETAVSTGVKARWSV